MLNEQIFLEELAALASKGLSRKLTVQDGSPLVNFSSNDYLGISKYPAVIEAAHEGLRKYGVGAASSRLLAGSTQAHHDLEADLAAFLNKEAALVFPSGYHVNTGVIPALAGSGDLIAFDRLSHASIIDGVRLSGASFTAFDHNDMNDLEKQIKKRAGKYRRLLIVSEGIFSMDGDVPPLNEMAAMARGFGAMLYLDEAHSIGVRGPRGQGVAAQFGCLDQIDIHVGTLSKSIGGQGGFVAGKKSLIDYLVTKCRSFLFTTALAPALAVAARKGLEVMSAMDQGRDRLNLAAGEMRAALNKAGWNTLQSSSQIIPILTGSVDTTKRLSDYLLSKGFFVPSIRPPTVPIGEARVRLSISFSVLDHIKRFTTSLQGADIGTAG